MGRLGMPGSLGSVRAGSFCAACRSGSVDGPVDIADPATAIVDRALGSWLEDLGSSTSCPPVTGDVRHRGPWEGRRRVTGAHSERNRVADKVARRAVHLEACC